MARKHQHHKRRNGKRGYRHAPTYASKHPMYPTHQPLNYYGLINHMDEAAKGEAPKPPADPAAPIPTSGPAVEKGNGWLDTVAGIGEAAFAAKGVYDFLTTGNVGAGLFGLRRGAQVARRAFPRIPVVPVGPPPAAFRAAGGLAAEGADIATAIEGVVGAGLVAGLPFGL